MCERIVELGRQGKSKAQMACDLGISYQTWCVWSQTRPDFSEAVKEAQWCAQAWWEDRGQEGLIQGHKFNATAFIFQVKNRFPASYRERQEHSFKSVAESTATTAEDVAKAEDPNEALRAFESFRRSVHPAGHA